MPVTVTKPKYLARSLSRWFGGNVARNEAGEIFVREISLREEAGSGEGQEFISQALDALDALRQQAGVTGPAMWLDIETAGWPGRPVFLVGMLCADGRDVVLRQLFARDYSEEGALLHESHLHLARMDMVLTFNGACFDLPFLRDRAAYHRLACPACRAHLDLLPLARRRWRGKLPNCRLKTLEAHVSRRPRTGDISSSEIPLRYHDYVHTQDAAIIAPVFRHNTLDMVALAQVSIALVKGDKDEPAD